jgi:hypothetical protein
LCQEKEKKVDKLLPFLVLFFFQKLFVENKSNSDDGTTLDGKSVFKKTLVKSGSIIGIGQTLRLTVEYHPLEICFSSVSSKYRKPFQSYLRRIGKTNVFFSSIN